MSKPRAYYNEFDPKAAAWLRELVKGGHIAPGDVDERSIEDIAPSDLKGYAQCHFFAGIGGWSYALRLAGWPDDKPVWTGSCPCQPFSAAGKGAGFADERHLWPAWFHLIRASRPSVVFGEQVASAMQWVDLVQGDLESQEYSCRYAVLGAHSVGAPHIRQRLYWVANSNRPGLGQQRSTELLDGERQAQRYDADGRGAVGELGDASQSGSGRDTGAVPSTQGETGRGVRSESDELVVASNSNFVGDSHEPGPQGRRIRWDSTNKRTTWSADLVSCRDEKWRPVEPGTFPLAHGVPGRVGLLRGYGNAIVPQVAEAFITAALGD